MRAVRTFRQLPWSERWLLLHAGLLVLAVRLSLSLLPFRLWRRVIAHLVQPHHRPAAGIQPARAAWMVRRISRYVPHATCLTQALALQLLLAPRGIASELRIGVKRGTLGEFQAHAWVLVDGTVVIGGTSELEHYAPLPVEALAG